jgi:hypothetical protein
MKKRNVSALKFLIAALVLILPVFASAADNCQECHLKSGVTLKIPPAPPIKMIVDGKERTLTLEGVFNAHGHECSGMTIAFRAVQHGISLLFPDKVPDRSDLIIASRTNAGGVKDLIDLVMRGDDPSDKTWSPPGMKRSREGLVFMIARKSTCEMVELRLKDGLFPEDFYELKSKEGNKTITREEWRKLHGYMQDHSPEIPGMPGEALFGDAKPSKVIVWGR